MARRVSGPPADFVAFCLAQHQRVVASVATYCGDPALAEEVAQEAFAKACQHWPRVREMDAPGAWLHRVALNLVKSRFRRRALERRVLPGQSMRDVHLDLDVGEVVDLRRALGRLPERRRDVLILRHVAGLSVAETAVAMGLSENAVRSLNSRALAALRNELEPTEVRHA